MFPLYTPTVRSLSLSSSLAVRKSEQFEGVTSTSVGRRSHARSVEIVSTFAPEAQRVHFGRARRSALVLAFEARAHDEMVKHDIIQTL